MNNRWLIVIFLVLVSALGLAASVVGMAAYQEAIRVAPGASVVVQCEPCATDTPDPTATATATPIPPTSTPTPRPTQPPTQTPTQTPTVAPSATPTNTPTPEPTAEPEFFPVGFMLAVYQDEIEAVANGGFNVVHPFGGAWCSLSFAQSYLERTAALGLYVIMDLLPCRTHEAADWNEQSCGEYISTLAAYDNLIAWYLPDEIDDFGLAATLYEWVQRYDPEQRPVYGNPGTFSFDIISRFPEFTDVLWGAWYPEYYGQPRAIVTHGVGLDAAACAGTDTTFGAILHFANSGNRGYPDAHEIRCDSYQAIIAGARGLWYYAYRYGEDLDGGAVFDSLVAIADEIIGSGGLDRVILSPDVPQTIGKSVVSGPSQSPPVAGDYVYDSIQTLQKERHLFTVNIGADDVVVEFSNLPALASLGILLYIATAIRIVNYTTMCRTRPQSIKVVWLHVAATHRTYSIHDLLPRIVDGDTLWARLCWRH